MISAMFRSAALSGFMALGLAASGPVLGADAPVPYKADLAHSQILFSIGHMGNSITHGSFKTFTIDLKFDPKKPEKTSANVVVDTSSVDTGFCPRDAHLQSADFFNVAKFPSMTFKSTKTEVTGTDSAKLTGNLTLAGVTKPVTLDIKVQGSGPSPFNPAVSVYGFNITGAIKRSEFNFGGGRFAAPADGKGGIGDDVAILISSEINNAPPFPGAPGAPPPQPKCPPPAPPAGPPPAPATPK